MLLLRFDVLSPHILNGTRYYWIEAITRKWLIYPSPFSRCSSKCAWPWDWLLELVKVICNYINRKSTHDFIFDGNSNCCLIFNYFQDICIQNMHDLDLDIYNRSRARITCILTARLFNLSHVYVIEEFSNWDYWQVHGMRVVWISRMVCLCVSNVGWLIKWMDWLYGWLDWMAGWFVGFLVD